MDIDFKFENNRINARVSVIIYNKDKSKVLLFRVDDGREYYMLPGGRIHWFEDSRNAIKREIGEEIGFDLDYELYSIQENFLDKNGEKIMQYCFCYKAIYDGEIVDEFKSKEKKNEIFCWIDIDKLSDYKLLPISSYELIRKNDVGFNHIIERS